MLDWGVKKKKKKKKKKKSLFFPSHDQSKSHILPIGLSIGYMYNNAKKWGDIILFVSSKTIRYNISSVFYSCQLASDLHILVIFIYGPPSVFYYSIRSTINFL